MAYTGEHLVKIWLKSDWYWARSSDFPQNAKKVCPGNLKNAKSASIRAKCAIETLQDCTKPSHSLRYCLRAFDRTRKWPYNTPTQRAWRHFCREGRHLKWSDIAAWLQVSSVTTSSPFRHAASRQPLWRFLVADECWWLVTILPLISVLRLEHVLFIWNRSLNVSMKLRWLHSIMLCCTLWTMLYTIFLRAIFFLRRVIAMKSVQNLKSLWRTSQKSVYLKISACRCID